MQTIFFISAKKYAPLVMHLHPLNLLYRSWGIRKSKVMFADVTAKYCTYLLLLCLFYLNKGCAIFHKMSSVRLREYGPFVICK
jgi:hypothetical protein